MDNVSCGQWATVCEPTAIANRSTNRQDWLKSTVSIHHLSLLRDCSECERSGNGRPVLPAELEVVHFRTAVVVGDVSVHFKMRRDMSKPTK